MKKGAIFLAMLFLFSGFSSHIANAQEEKSEKKRVNRIKIVTVDDKGERTVIDTTITGEVDFETLDLGEGMKWVHSSATKKDGKVIIMSHGDDKSFSFHMSDDDKIIEKKENVYIVRKGGGHDFTIISADSDNKAHKDMAFFKYHDEEFEEGQSHIIIRSKGEVTDLVISGDAVITIKDGKVNVEGDKIKIDTEKIKILKEIKEDEGKVVKEEKVIKKRKEKK